MKLRKFPYPYRAALSICSDIDGTDTKEDFDAVRSLIRDKIGLKFSSGFLPFHEDNKFSFYSGRAGDKKAIIDSIRKGEIDALHSYGHKTDFDRATAQRILKELVENDCRLEIWTDHAYSKSNLCKFRFQGRGDIPDAREYHMDLTERYGIKFIWTEHLTNLIGQDVPLPWLRLGGILDLRHPLHSGLTVLKTGAKLFLGEFGSKKYSYFRKNKLVNISTLADGRKIFEFIRFSNYVWGPNNGDSFGELHYLIAPKVLKRLIKRGGYSLVYVHLGRNFRPETEMGQKAVEALRNLKKEEERGTILVDSTLRLLHYYVVQKFLRWTSEFREGGHWIRIESVDDPVSGPRVPRPEELRGITFYVPGEARVFIREDEVKAIKANPPDYTGRKSIMISV
jgi:hypothetical protein